MNSIIKFLTSFRYASKGIGLLLKYERNAKIHFFISIIVIGAGVFLGVSQTEWIHLTLCIGMVLSLEGINTALEKLTDLVSPDFHPLAGTAKDLAAGAVLIGSITAAVIGIIIFYPYLTEFIN